MDMRKSVLFFGGFCFCFCTCTFGTQSQAGNSWCGEGVKIGRMRSLMRRMERWERERGVLAGHRWHVYWWGDSWQGDSLCVWHRYEGGDSCVWQPDYSAALWKYDELDTELLKSPNISNGQTKQVGAVKVSRQALAAVWQTATSKYGARRVREIRRDIYVFSHRKTYKAQVTGKNRQGSCLIFVCVCVL